MSETGEQPALPAAWYPDPQNSAVLRWWDGVAWTPHVKELPPPPTDLIPTPMAAPVVPPAPVEPPVAAAPEYSPEPVALVQQPVSVAVVPQQMPVGVAQVEVAQVQSAPTQVFPVPHEAPPPARAEAVNTGPLTPQEVAHRRAMGTDYLVVRNATPAAAAAEGFLIRTSVPESRTRYSESGARLAPLSTRNDLPAAVRDDNDDFDKDDDVGSKHTVEIWVLALLPGFAFAAEYGFFLIPHMLDNNPHLFWIVPVLLFGLGFVFAQLDRGTLLSRNIKNAPPGWIGLLPPIYMIVRGIQVTAASVLPLILWIALVAAVYTPSVMLFVEYLKLVAASHPAGG